MKERAEIVQVYLREGDDSGKYDKYEWAWRLWINRRTFRVKYQ